MSLGVTVRTRTAPPSRGAPTDTGTAFVVGQALTGPLDAPTECRSIADFAGAYGARVTGNAPLYDWVDTFFREGGTRAFVGRYTDAGTVDDGLALFTKGLGPGQVAATDETPGAATYGKLLDHAEQNNRYAICDVARATPSPHGDARRRVQGARPTATTGCSSARGSTSRAPPASSAAAPATVHGSRGGRRAVRARRRARQPEPRRRRPRLPAAVRHRVRHARSPTRPRDAARPARGQHVRRGLRRPRALRLPDRPRPGPRRPVLAGQLRPRAHVAQGPRAAAGEKYAFRTIDGRGRSPAR
jgi:hypothetical protein